MDVQRNAMEGQPAGEFASKNSAQGVASYAHHDRIALNAPAEVLASSSALLVESSAHSEKLAHERNSLNGSAAAGVGSSSAERTLGSLHETAGVVHNNFPQKSARDRNALGSPYEAAKVVHSILPQKSALDRNALGLQYEAAKVVHSNLPQKSALDKNALGSPCAAAGILQQSKNFEAVVRGSPCKAAASHNESTDSRQHKAPCCEAVIVSSSVNSNSFPEKASLKGSPCEAVGHNKAADSGQQQQAPKSPPFAVAKLKTYTWHGIQLTLPVALRLCKWCSIEDGVLEFRGSDAALREGMLLLDAAALDLQYNILDGALWLKMPSSQYTDMLPGTVGYLLGLWEKRSGLVGKYIVSGSSGMIYSSVLPKMLIANCCIFDVEKLSDFKIRDNSLWRVVPRDLGAEVAFECVSATDNPRKTWEKCECYVSTNRAKMAVGICDRANQKEMDTIRLGE